MDLFIKTQPPACAYCLFVRPKEKNKLVCMKFGEVKPTHKCKKFVYDPLKRIPPKPVVIKQNFKPEEFKID